MPKLIPEPRTLFTAAGTNLEPSTCPSDGSGGIANCFAAYLALHLTPKSTAYLEVRLLE